jgi:hypothetical protein
MNIIVASHRRSGTHLTIDTIANNAFIEFDIENYDKIRFVSEEEDFSQRDVILKTHMNGLVFEKYLSNFDKNSTKVLYVYRDGRGVMQSLYNYEKNDVDFKSFINGSNIYNTEEYDKDLSKLEYWAFHVKSWLEHDFVIPVKYEELSANYEATINKIFNELGFESIAGNVTDIRQSSRLVYYIKKYILRQKLTTVKFKSGRVSSFTKYFDDHLDKQYFEVLTKYDIEKYF